MFRYGIALTVCIFILPVSLYGQRVQPKLIREVSTAPHAPLYLLADARDQKHLYAALQKGGLQVFDISKLQLPPRAVATVPVSKLHGLEVTSIAQKGDLLYVGLGSIFHAGGSKAGLAIVSVKNPLRPTVLSIWTSPKVAHGSSMVLVSGNVAYLAAMSEGIKIFDITRPGGVKLIGAIQPDIHFPRRNPNRTQHPNARGMALRGNLLFVAYDAGGLRVLDVTNKAKPKEVARYINPKMKHKPQAYNNIILHKDLAFLAVDYAGLEVLDIRNPRKIQQVGWWNPWSAEKFRNLWFNSAGHTNQLALDPNRKLIYLSAGDSELQIVSVANPKKPQLVGKHGKPKNKQGVWSATFSSGRIYLGYIQTIIPFRGTWSGIKVLR